MRRCPLAGLVFWFLALRTGLPASLSTLDQTAVPGQTLVTTFSLSSEGQAISGIQFDLEWDPMLSVQFAPGREIGRGSKTLYSVPLSPTAARFLVIGTGEELLADGELLRLLISIPSQAAAGAAFIKASNAVATGPDGQPVSLQPATASVQTQTGATTTLLFPPEAVLNAGSLSAGPISPGEIITILGVRDASAPVGILVNGVNAPILYAGLNQVNAIVPFELDVSNSARLEIQRQGYETSSVSLPVAPAAPGLFSQLSNGTGPGAILNQDYSLNSYANPAPVGSVIMLYGTGFGTLDPLPVNGQAANGPAKTSVPVTARIGGVAAEVLYAGAAPGLVAGVVQINVRVPGNLQPDTAAPVSLSIGSADTPPGVTVSIR